MDRKKELKLEYARRKPDMGVFIYESGDGGEGEKFIGWARDLKAMLNKCNFTLELGTHTNKALQAAWFGSEGALKGRVLETLPYSEDESITDYGADLETLLEMWLEKLPEAKRI